MRRSFRRTSAAKPQIRIYLSKGMTVNVKETDIRFIFFTNQKVDHIRLHLRP